MNEKTEIYIKTYKNLRKFLQELLSKVVIWVIYTRKL